MKKTLLLLLLAFASTTTAFSQARPGGTLTSKDYTGGGTTNSRNTGFGVKGGYSLSNFFGDGKDAFKNRDNLNTYHVGAYGQFGFNNFSSVQVEVLYSRKGIRYDNPTLSDFRLDYISVPVLYVGNVTDAFSFHIGPEVSLLTKVNSNGNNLDIKANGFNSVDVGGLFGLEYRVGPARVGARYDLGLARVLDNGTVFKTASTPNPTAGRITNQTLQLYLGIGFTQ